MLIPRNNHSGIAIIAVGGVASTIAILAISLRVWARKLKGARLDASDWTCILGVLIALVLYGLTINGVTQGFGLPIEQFTPEQNIQFSKYLLVGMSAWTASSTLIRISILLLYVRVLLSRNLAIFCYMLLIENLLCVLATYLAMYLICQPFAFNWNHAIQKGHCGNVTAFYTWTGVQSMLHDVATIVLPIPLLYRMKLPRKKKVHLIMVFAAGSGICILTLVRTIEVAMASARQNVSKAYVSIDIISILEPLLGSIGCCIPLLRPVAQRLGIMRENSTTSKEKTDNFIPHLQSIGTRRVRTRPHDAFSIDTFRTIDEEDDHTSCVGVVENLGDANSYMSCDGTVHTIRYT